MQLIMKPSLVAVLILVALFSCEKKHTGGGGLRSLGDLTVNGPQFDGSVHAGTKVLYTLKNIQEGKSYTLRTELSFLQDAKTPDGTLTADIYSSGDAFATNPTAPLESAVPQPAPNANIYEVYFKAPSSGDFVVVIDGKSSSIANIQFFYNLRLMSADPTADPRVLTSFTTPTIPASDAQLVKPLNPGYLNIYNGGEVTPSGVYNITLESNATSTLVNPQIFVYQDSTLKVSSLMLSSIPTATEFVITSFNAGVPITTNELGTNVNTNVISNVTFTNQADDSVNHIGGPFIVLKGLVSAVTYTLSIGP
jgi:hypothetical protein